MEAHIISFALLACALAVFAAPATNRRQDIHQLVSLMIKNIRDMKSMRDALPSLANTGNAAKVSDFPELHDSQLIDAFENEESLKKGFLGQPIGSVIKRQGAWSYDYGLGGGRFGKRNYGDYGIGGGRFGRDVDHVDLSDANDADLAS